MIFVSFTDSQTAHINKTVIKKKIIQKPLHRSKCSNPSNWEQDKLGDLVEIP